MPGKLEQHDAGGKRQERRDKRRQRIRGPTQTVEQEHGAIRGLLHRSSEIVYALDRLTVDFDDDVARSVGGEGGVALAVPDHQLCRLEGSGGGEQGHIERAVCGPRRIRVAAEQERMDGRCVATIGEQRALRAVAKLEVWRCRRAASGARGCGRRRRRSALIDVTFPSRARRNSRSRIPQQSRQ